MLYGSETWPASVGDECCVAFLLDVAALWGIARVLKPWTVTHAPVPQPSVAAETLDVVCRTCPASYTSTSIIYEIHCQQLFHTYIHTAG